VRRTALVDSLLHSGEPSIRWRVLDADAESAEVGQLQDQVRSSPRVRSLLARRAADGRINSGGNVYAKWQGAHWVLATLADIGYPAGDASLSPLRDQVLECWLQDGFYVEFEAHSKAGAYRRAGVPIMHGRYRRCASQQGNALYALSQLGLLDDNADQLVERLLHWQWPDGGWNCDKNPVADTSSFMETLIPMRGLALYGRLTNDQRAREAARRAAEVFLDRRLFKRRSNGRLIHPEFVQLHYPLYWHYDILGGLKVLAEVGVITDPRCADALDVLEQKELPDGGWPAERRYYKVSSQLELHADYVDWGGTSKLRMNEWVTSDALYVLRAAGRV
jgi:hypothetical protein